MATPITLSVINGLLLPLLNTAYMDFYTYGHLYTEVYQTFSSDMAIEYDQELRGLPLAKIKFDGGPIASGDMGMGNKAQYIHQYYGISFTISRAAQRFNQYKKQFPQQAKSMKESLLTVKNINAMYIFNNAFNAKSKGSDGLPMCSTQHPYQGGVYANTFNNAVTFSQRALEDAYSVITGTWVNAAGIANQYEPHKLLMPTLRQFDVLRVTGSEFEPDGNSNAINPFGKYKDRFLPGGYTINRFLTNPYNWYLLTKYDQGFKHFVAEPLQIDFMSENRTYNTVVSALECYSFGYTSPRGVFGVMGS